MGIRYGETKLIQIHILNENVQELSSFAEGSYNDKKLFTRIGLLKVALSVFFLSEMYTLLPL